MSWDLSLSTTLDGHVIEVPGFSANYTHNTNGMIREAGFPEWPYEVDGMGAGEVAERLQIVLEVMRSDPARFREMNPANGWGDFDSLLGVLERVRQACAEYPSATVRMWA